MLVTILLWIVFGFVVGLIARAVVPGGQSMGFIATTLLGIVGSFVGGLVATLLTGGFAAHNSGFHTVGFIGSLLGAILVLAIAGFSRRRMT